MTDLPVPKNTITPDTFPRAKLHPMLAMMPDYLKDPKNYEKIKKAILKAGQTKHSHGEVVDWAGCQTCQQKQMDRLLMMKKRGFQSAAQYKAWDKVHNKIAEFQKVALPKYNKP